MHGALPSGEGLIYVQETHRDHTMGLAGKGSISSETIMGPNKIEVFLQ
jgi:hypothetical protein